MKRKLRLQLILACLLVCFGIVMITIAFYLPPTGQIDPTVLTAYGETLTFAGALFGIDYHYKKTLNEDPSRGRERPSPTPPRGGERQDEEEDECG